MKTDVGPFAIVPLWLLESGASPRAIQLYALMAAKYADRDGACFPAVPTLAKDVQTSEMTVHRALTELVAIGAMNRAPRWNATGGHRSNLYSLRFAKPQLSSSESLAPSNTGDTTPGNTDETTSGNTDGTLTRPSKNHTQDTPPRIPTPAGARAKKDAEKPLAEDFIKQMAQTYIELWSETETRERIEEALNHKAALKAKKPELYVRGWLRRDAEEARLKRSKGRPTRAEPRGSGNVWQQPWLAQKEANP